jgi:hypothetical protein
MKTKARLSSLLLRLEADKRLTLADRITVFYQPLHEHRVDPRAHRPLPASPDDAAKHRAGWDGLAG